MRFNLSTLTSFSLAMGLSVGLLGCGESDTPSPKGDRGNPASASQGDLFLTEAPEGAKSVVELKASAKEGDEVVMHVIVGGNMNPMVEGRMAMNVIDADLANACVGEDDHCSTPWDYCCTPGEDKTANMATVQVVDADGRPLSAGWGAEVGPLAVLTIKGVVGPRASAESLVVNATGIYVEQAQP